MIVHTLKMCTLFWACFIIFFLIFDGCWTFFPCEMLRGCLVCVICNSSSIRSCIFKLRGGAGGVVGWLLCYYYLTNVLLLWMFCGSSSRCRGLVCSILTDLFDNDCSHIEDLHPLFCAHLIFFFSISDGCLT